MSTYSEPLEPHQVEKKLGGDDSVTILVCPVCASVSISYYRDLPVYRLSWKFTHTYGSEYEVKRLRAVLERSGKKVDVYGLNIISAPFCTPDLWKRFQIRRHCKDADAVVVYSCVGGLVGVRQALGKGRKVIHGMRTVGCGTNYLRWAPPFELVLDMKRSRISRIREEQKAD